MGVPIYQVNEDFFKEWTAESAWVYGWLLTDGHISAKSGHTRLALKDTDSEVLYKIKTAMQFTGDVKFREYCGKKSAVLCICRKSITNDLFDLGMAKSDKTFNTTMPDIPDTLFWHFVRGVFEGDGSIRHRTGNTDALDITITGATKKFMIDLRDALAERGVLMRINVRKANSCSGNKHDMYSLNTKSNADALRMSFFMYANCPRSTVLTRKFDVYRNYVETYYDHIRRRSKPCIELVELSRKFIA